MVQNAFARIKYFRAITTKYDKLKPNYASILVLAFINESRSSAKISIHGAILNKLINEIICTFVIVGNTIH
ncbi:hypothetical protein XBP1_2370001 [Xenorhabdus bovienii str. puntauvense]|uniref:Uncharacterized protein n=1 Tax=Xenorhabdus bovienii str. puntauvense TaxID=1398201 RepID=A0A077NEW8_XENBV|nr:hypothetical protein XBFFR1_2390053 [Xenorhabdus bovienii str. feltiae France]CDG94638.1 hypothetical protein XBFFL1_850001 [Xenorhabdus bovienii str. feltiae Florida]CDG96897.1 hypothetical protein XBP1_2370001 [Xenorhabdus bovienii str. puntauvense]